MLPWLTLPLACTRPAPPPSVLLVSWDTVGELHLGRDGAGARTPNLDALAARGARYTQAVTHFPETSFTHWVLMTGVEPALHGDVPAAMDSTWTGPTLAERLADQGYATGAFVSGITLDSELTGLDRGFDVYDDAGDPGREPRRSAPETVAVARAWLDAQTQPTFTFVHLFDAHFPYEPAPGCDPGYTGALTGSMADLQPYQGAAPPRPVLPPEDLAHVVALYRCEIEGLDAALGALLAGLRPDTRVVLVADHGESFGHGYYFNHRDALTDEVLRVPLVVAPPPPGLSPGATVSDQIGLSRVTDLVLGLRPPGDPVVVSLTDPWEGDGRLSLRAGEDKAIYRLVRGDARRVDGGPIQVLRGDVDTGARTLPDSLLGAIQAYEARITAQWPQVRLLPRAAWPAGLPEEALQAIGYRDPPSPAPAPP